MKSNRIPILLLMATFAGMPQVTAAARLSPPTVFVPAGKDSIQSFYVNGQPIAISLADSLGLMLALDVDEIAGKDFVRLWAFVQNNSGQTVELIPQSQFVLKALNLDFSLVRTARAQTPTAVLQQIEDEKTTRQSLALLSGAVASLGAALSARNSTGTARTVFAPGHGSATTTLELNDAAEKLNARLGQVGSNTLEAVDRLQRLYEGAKAAVSSEMLRRNTLPPGLSANGCLFFDLETATVVEAPAVRNRKFERPRDQTYVLFVRIPGFSERQISFWPSEGE